MRRLITAALTSACLVSSPAMLWADQYEIIPGVGRIMTTNGGKVYCHPEKETLCTSDELKKIETVRRDKADARARTAACVHACGVAADKCEKEANAGKNPTAPSCTLVMHNCQTRC
jgi:hypothetical protein